MKGDLYNVTVCRDDTIIFAGQAKDMDGRPLLYDKNGSVDLDLTMTFNDKTIDMYGNVVDPYEPSITETLDIVMSPELSHKGNWYMWACGVIICLLNAITIIFANEIFKFAMSFKIANAEFAEPSSLFLKVRNIEWAIITTLALIVFIIGLI